MVQLLDGEQVSHTVEWPGHKAENSLPSSAKVKKKWNYTSTSPHSFMVYRATLLLLHYIHTRTHSKSLAFFHKSIKCTYIVLNSCWHPTCTIFHYIKHENVSMHNQRYIFELYAIFHHKYYFCSKRMGISKC